MPRSAYPLFVSQYPPKPENIDIGDIVTARIKAFNYQPRRFKIVSIQDTVEDRGETRWIYYGVPIQN